MENQQLGCIAAVMVSILAFSVLISQYGIDACRLHAYGNFLAAYQRLPNSAERISIDKQCSKAAEQD